MVGINYDGDDNLAWFDPDSLDQCDIFMNKDATAHQISGKS